MEESICVLLNNGFLLDEPSWLAVRATSHGLKRACDHPLFPLLLPHQRLHFLRLLRALQTGGTAGDISPMGRGKNFCGAAVIKAMGRKAVVWGPPSSELNWRQAFDHFGVEAEFYSYSRVQAKKPPYLDKVKKPSGEIEFQVKDEWQSVCLVILDEVQYLINRCQRADALLNLVKTMNPLGAVLCLSGTALSRLDQTSALARLMRIVKREPLAVYNPGTRQLDLVGLQDCFDLCEKIDPGFRMPNMSNHNSMEALHHCMSHTLRRHLFFSMPKPHQMLFPRKTYNLFCDQPLETDHALALTNGLDDAFASLARQAPGQLTSALKTIERAKLQYFADFANHFLEEPSSKVILMLNFTSSIKTLRHVLSMHDPLVITNETPLQRRNGIRKLFQKESLQKRLLISTSTLLATGCDLDDQSLEGEFPRRMAVSPCQSMAVKEQVPARVERLLTTSQAEVYTLLSGDREALLMQKVAERGKKAAFSTSQQWIDLHWKQIL